MPALPQQCDVLIVGAGPTGLMLANQLARHGIDALIIDRHAGPARETRALGVQARTMEIYTKLGLMERALELGKRATGANFWSGGRRTARVPLGDIGRDLSPYPFLLILGQDDNERLLGDALRTHGRDVAWNTELIGLEQKSDRVITTDPPTRRIHPHARSALGRGLRWREERRARAEPHRLSGRAVSSTCSSSRTRR